MLPPRTRCMIAAPASRMNAAAMSATTLHITNGDSVAYLVKKAGLLGTHLPWTDALYEGPVPGDLTLEGLSALRADYAAARGYGSAIALRRDVRKRDATVLRAAEFDEVVIWMEHDLFDQLQLVQILAILHALDLEPGRVALVQTDSYLGMMTPAEIEPLFPKRRTVTVAAFAQAQRAWSAFTSGDPHRLLAVAREETRVLPHLRAAFLRLCEEFPWTLDGLSRSQRSALQAIAYGPGRTDELFRRAQAREEAPFLSDAHFTAILGDLRAGAAPLVEGEEGALVPTALGRRALAGDADWIADAPIDRWIGGVHLVGSTPPRWDDTTQRFDIAETVGE